MELPSSNRSGRRVAKSVARPGVRQLRSLLAGVLMNGLAATVSAQQVVVADTNGPRLLSAVVTEEDKTNQIRVSVSERLLGSSISSSNFVITLAGAALRVPVMSALYVPALPGVSPPTVLLWVATNHWHLGGISNYVLTVNGIRDHSSNVIAPDSRVALSWPRTHYLVLPGAEWRYRFVETNSPILAMPWFATNLVDDTWMRGRGPFRASLEWWHASCLDWWPPNLQAVSPIVLFRTTFVWGGTNGPGLPPLLSLEHLIKDEGIIYLNGTEIFRYSVPTGIIWNADAIIAPPDDCQSRIDDVPGATLWPGTNWLSAAVTFGWAELVFALGLRRTEYLTGPLPDSPPPVLAVERSGTDSVRLSWSGFGFALESTTTIGPDGKPGPWTEVPNMSNPYTGPAFDALRFYRLRR